MTHASLFSGIGGFDLAAEWAGWENIFHCEKDKFCQKVLKYHFPNSIQHDDIKTTDFTIYRGKIDILTGGFPCQPFSIAGKRKGTTDDRYLWDEMLRAIREIRPTYVVGENVFGLVNLDRGMVFDKVQADLEAEGYEVAPVILPACGKDAPHRRERIWFVACDTSSIRLSWRWYGKYRLCKKTGKMQIKILTSSRHSSNSNGLKRINSKNEIIAGKRWKYAQHDVKQDVATDTEKIRRREGNRKENNNNRWEIAKFIIERSKIRNRDKTISGTRIITNTNSGRQSSKEHRKEESGQFAKKSIPGNWENFPTQSPICSGNDGIPGKLDGITFPKWRNESIKAYGNAIVPQVAYEIFKVINEMQKTKYENSI